MSNQVIQHPNSNTMNNSLKLMNLRKACVAWGKSKECVTKVILFGSKVDGIKCSENDPKKQSDWDVAVEFNPLPNDEDHLTTWICEKENWQNELEAFLNDKNFGVIDFQGYHPGAEHVINYVKQKSIVLFDRSLHC